MNSKRSSEIQDAFRAVRNFCTDYSLSDINEMLALYHRELGAQAEPGGGQRKIEDKERILDFLESLEELLPAVYQIEQLRKEEISMSSSN